MRESKIEWTLTDEVEKAGGECIKITSPNRKGVNDRLIILPSEIPIQVYYKLFWVEVKQKKKKPSHHQKEFHKRMVELNQKVIVLDDVDQIPLIVK